MGLTYDFTAPVAPVESTSPLSKRRRFTPQALPFIIPMSDNSDIETHTFDSPLLLQLCEQAPDQAEIEAGLLQVGMRVRKSVADGYKTQKKFTPRPFFNMHRLSPETQAALMASGNADAMEDVASVAASQNLTTSTFCGISLSFLSNYPDDWSNSAVSQQQLWSYSTSSKRGYEADSDSDEGQDWQPLTPNIMAEAGMQMPMDYFAIDMDSMADVGSMSHIGEQARQAFHGRRMALPKTRSRLNVQQQIPAAPAVFNPFANMTPVATLPTSFGGTHSGHKRMVSCGMEAAMDFGDAPFLQRREDVEMDCS